MMQLLSQCGRSRHHSMQHNLFRDDHKKEYNYGFLCAVDCDGICRIAAGHHPGSMNDVSCWYDSDPHGESQTAFTRLGGKHLVDGIFARVISPDQSQFITPYCYMRRDLTVAEQRYNDVHSWD